MNMEITARDGQIATLKHQLADVRPDAHEQRALLPAFTEALNKRYGEESHEAIMYFALTAQSLGRLQDGRPARPLEGAEVEERRGNQSTEYRIRGHLAAVLAEIAARFSQFHPEGYGTMCHAIQHESGQYVARMSRSNSCE